MNIIRLFILDKDKEYGSKLGEAISNLHNDIQVSIVSFDIMENINDKLDFILIGGYEKVEIDKLGISYSKIIKLVDEEVKNLEEQISNSKGEKVLELYKYTRVSELVSDIKYLFGVMTGKTNIGKLNVNTSIIGFYSASGGTGKTVVSISTARELSIYHDKRVLYLGFDEVSATSLYMKGGSAKRNIGDFLYYLFNKDNENLCSFIEGFIFSDEYRVDTFYTSIGRNELKRLNKDELAYFFKVILYCNLYDYIMLDLGNDLTEESIYLLNYCNRVVFIEEDSNISKYKCNKLIEYMNKLIGIEFTKNFIRVNNKIVISNDSEEKNVIEIEKDDNSFCYTNGYMEISINHVFGLGIKKIVDHIIVPN